MEKDSREVHFSEARKKLDCIQPFDNVPLSGSTDRLQQGSKCDLRKSLAWDSAFLTSPGVLDPEELFATLNIRGKDVAVDGERSDRVLPSISIETERITRINEYNARRSLAWDSAFFTSPGVLEPEELFAALNIREDDIAVDGERSNKTLPSTSSEAERIRRTNEHNARRSLAWDSAFFTNPGVLDAEELSLLNSGFSRTEVHTLPKINGELRKSADLSSTLQSSRYSVTSIEIDLFEDLRTSLCKSSTKYDVATSNVKHEGTQETQFLKETDASARRKSKPLPPLGRQRTNVHRQKRTQKEGSSLTQQAKRVGCRVESTLLSYQKPPKVLCRAKPENSSSMSDFGRNMGVHKNRCSREQHGSSPTQKSSYLGYAFSDPSAKSPTSGWRRTLDSRLTGSDSFFQTPSRCPNRRNELLSSSKPRFMLSKPKASPASCSSSTDGWSSDSATSLNQRSFPCTSSLDMSTFRAGLFDNGGSSSSCTALDSEVPEHCRKTPTKVTLLSDVALEDVKPSALRMPLPKIGFFDSENPRKEKKAPKYHSSADAANKSKYGKSQKPFPKESTSPLERRNPAVLSSLQNKSSCNPGRRKISKAEDNGLQEWSKSETGVRITTKNIQTGKRSCLKKENGLVHEENKENISGFENRVDCLSRDIEAIDLNGDLVIELQMKNPRFK